MGSSFLTGVMTSGSVLLLPPLTSIHALLIYSDLSLLYAPNRKAVITRCTMLRGMVPGLRGSHHLENVAKSIGKRGIAASTSQWAKKMPDRPSLVDESEFTEAFLKGSGPGGQKIVRLLGFICATLAFPQAGNMHETANRYMLEQNLLCCAIEAYSHRFGTQSSSHTIPPTESQDCKRDASIEGRGARERQREQGCSRWGE